MNKEKINYDAEDKLNKDVNSSNAEDWASDDDRIISEIESPFWNFSEEDVNAGV